MVRTKPVPFPPEPLRWLGIELTRCSMARADRNRGSRNLWPHHGHPLGLGFGN